MTLLLNLVGPRGIHQSSDYRLTSVSMHRPIDDEFGSKQVHHIARGWTAQISFTGFAQIGNRKTQEWILECLNGADASADAVTVLDDVAARAAFELRPIPQKDWFLIIVATVTDEGGVSLFVISCMGNPSGAPNMQPLDHFAVYEIATSVQRELIFGCTNAVSQADRKFLAKLNRGKVEPTDIRSALARINARSARRSKGAVSEACLVASTMPDGTTITENVGRTPGNYAGSAELLDQIYKGDGGKMTFVQGRGGRIDGTQFTFGPINTSEGSTQIIKTRGGGRMLFATDSLGDTVRLLPRRTGVLDEAAEWARLEQGDPGPARKIAFSSTPHSITFNGPDGSAFAVVEFSGTAGEVIVMRNRAPKITLGELTVRLLPGSKRLAEVVKGYGDIRSAPTIDRAQPHNWVYTVDLAVDKSIITVSIRQNSAALRSDRFPSMSCVTGSEELVVVANMEPRVIRLSPDALTATASIEARLLVRPIQMPTTGTPIRSQNSATT
jgi:hypothetical protein